MLPHAVVVFREWNRFKVNDQIGVVTRSSVRWALVVKPSGVVMGIV